MRDDWFEILLGGVYEVALHDLNIQEVGGQAFRGSGHLRWQAESGLRAHAITPGGPPPWAELFRGLGQPGRLAPQGAFVSVTGRTPQGWEVTTAPALPDRTYLGDELPHIEWGVQAHGLSLGRDADHGSERVIRALLGPPPADWIRMSETVVTNECFPARAWHRDWLTATAGFGRVAARRRTDQWFEVRLNVSPQFAGHTPFQLLTAVGRAFGFLSGRRTLLLGFEENAPGRTSRHLESEPGPPSDRSLLSPLGRNLAYRENAERLLGLATDYFLTEAGDQVAHHLYLCWDTTDNAIQTRLVVASVCLEGLLRIVGESGAASDQADVSAGRAAAEAWLAGGPAGVSAAFANRLRAFLRNMGAWRPVDTLRRWASGGVLGVTPDDVDAWNRIRNPSAHGALIVPTEDRADTQALLSRYIRIQNLMNRVLLHLVGYTGRYTNYAADGWPDVEFPAAPADSL